MTCTTSAPAAPDGAGPPAPVGPGLGEVVRDLARHGTAVAVHTAEAALTYAELARRVEDTAARLGSGRLVLVAGSNEVEPLVAYLAGLAAGSPVLLAPGDDPDRLAGLVAAYDPDVVVRPTASGWQLQERREGSAHDLHPDLALLLSTSGTTGSPKLVRLSQANLRANAESIAQYLDVRPSDRAATTLPLHYSYGLSVVNSHLLRGAGLVLTGLSVVDPCFWALFRHAGATSFAGVPHTFELLDRAGIDLRLPALRYVTCAGGRLAPDRVRAYAELGRRAGFELFVMYGQTEATARMAYLPPELAASRPEALGVPVPGGAFRLEPLPAGPDADGQDWSHLGPGVGELVYSGPNVMMGYATGPADLRLGAGPAELRTGDLARLAADGLYEVVGRRSRFAKVLGLRVDLQHVEARLAEQGTSACAVEVDGGVLVAVERAPARIRTCLGGRVAPRTGLARLRRRAARACGLPGRAVHVVVVDRLPRLATGKPDLAAVRGLAPQSAPPAAARCVADRAAVRRLFAEVLERDEVHDDDTFVSLGGDSLSYVEVSLRLEEALGRLPADWHVTPVRDLAVAPDTRPPGLDVSVALRAAAIVVVVASHANVLTIVGGAHLLVAVAGHNAARFVLSSSDRAQRVRSLLRSAARIAVPSVVCIAVGQWLTGAYGLANLVLLNDLLGPRQLGPPWQFWFVEVLVHLLLLLTALLSVPALDRAERRRPLAFALAVFGAGLLTRFDVVPLPAGPHETQTAASLLWLFALGWATARAGSAGARLTVTAAALLAVPGFSGDPVREALVVGGLLLLTWTGRVPWPGALRRPAAALARASLWIYLTHWQVFPHLQDDYPLLALAASLAVGVAAERLGRATGARLAAAYRAGHPVSPPTLPTAPAPLAVPYLALPGRRPGARVL